MNEPVPETDAMLKAPPADASVNVAPASMMNRAPLSRCSASPAKAPSRPEPASSSVRLSRVKVWLLALNKVAAPLTMVVPPPFSVPPVKLATPASVRTPLPLSVAPDWVRLWMVSVMADRLMLPGSTRSLDTAALTVTGAEVSAPLVAVTVKLPVALPSLTNSTAPAANCASVKLVIAVPGAPDNSRCPWTAPVTWKVGFPPPGSTAVKSAVATVPEAP